MVELNSGCNICPRCGSKKVKELHPASYGYKSLYRCLSCQKEYEYRVKMAENNICPRCGCPGKKTPHTRIMNEEEAKVHAWKDLKCSSCNYCFRVPMASIGTPSYKK